MNNEIKKHAVIKIVLMWKEWMKLLTTRQLNENPEYRQNKDNAPNPYAYNWLIMFYVELYTVCNNRKHVDNASNLT